MTNTHYDVQILLETRNGTETYTAESPSFEAALESMEDFVEDTTDEILAFEVKQKPENDDRCPVCHNTFPDEYDDGPHAPVFVEGELQHRACAFE